MAYVNRAPVVVEAEVGKADRAVGCELPSERAGETIGVAAISREGERRGLSFCPVAHGTNQ